MAEKAVVSSLFFMCSNSDVRKISRMIVFRVFVVPLQKPEYIKRPLNILKETGATWLIEAAHMEKCSTEKQYNITAKVHIKLFRCG